MKNSAKRGNKISIPRIFSEKKGFHSPPPWSISVETSLQTLPVILHLLKVTTKMVPLFMTHCFKNYCHQQRKNVKKTRVIKIWNELSCSDFEKNTCFPKIHKVILKILNYHNSDYTNIKVSLRKIMENCPHKEKW